MPDGVKSIIHKTIHFDKYTNVNSCRAYTAYLKTKLRFHLPIALSLAA